MKTKALSVFFAGLLAMAVNAQDFKCEDNFKALGTAVKSTDYTTAAPILAGLRKSCPKYNVKVYSLGEKVLKYNLDTAQSDGDRSLYATDLVALYTDWEKNFPATGGVQKKALFLHENKLAKDDEVFALLDEAFAANKTSFTDYNVLELYFNLYLARYNAGNKGITPDQFIAKFGDMAGQTAYAQAFIQKKKQELTSKKETQPLDEEEALFLKEAPQSLSALKAVSDNMAGQFPGNISCEKLEGYYKGLFEKNKTDKVWLGGLVAVMSKACKPTPVLYNAAVELDKLSPSLDTELLLGDLSRLYGEPKESAAYYEKAITFEADSVGKANIYLTIAANYRNSDRAAAKSYLLKAASFNPKDGSPYLKLAEMYAGGGGCELGDFERKALLWLAIDTAKKAEATEPKLKPSVAALLKRYEAKVPTKEDLKAANKSKGDIITYGCWINETVTVPKVK